MYKIQVPIPYLNFLIDPFFFVNRPVVLSSKNEIRRTVHKEIILKFKEYWFKDYYNHYKMITMDLREHQALQADLKAIQQIIFTGNLAQNSIANTITFFINDESKETILVFSQEIVKKL